MDWTFDYRRARASLSTDSVRQRTDRTAAMGISCSLNLSIGQEFK
jgi:hypothetical protein